jgi:CHAD domain-containing protein
MTVSATETELKFDAASDLVLPGLDGLPGVARTETPREDLLIAEYFDTADLRLLRAGITLRRRSGGADAGWHLKLPAGAHTRTEIRLPLGEPDDEVPGELASLVRARSRQLTLRPVARLTTLRRTTTLVDVRGDALAEIADDEVTATRPEGSVPDLHWREIEVELAGGSEELLDAAAHLLREAGLRPSANSAKLQRVLEAPPTGRAQARELTASSPAWEAVVAYLAATTEELARLDPLVRREQPDAVHQMRVATRRLRSALRTFGSVVSGDATADLAAELQWLGGILGQARDCEVQSERLQQQVAGMEAELLLGPVPARIQSHFAEAGASARDAVLAALTSRRYDTLLDALDAVIADPPLGPDAQESAGSVLRASVLDSFAATRRRIRRARHAPPGYPRDVLLHRARRAAKRARYAAEAVTPVAGEDAEVFARQMKKVQSVLGEYQDTVVGSALARHLGVEANLADENAFSYGVLYGRELARRRELGRAARRVWRHASGKGYRQWMRAG